MFHFNYYDSDPTNPFLGQCVSLREHHVIGMPKGPSMLEEKLACAMEDAAHERQFQTAQQGSSAPDFLGQHVSIVTRTIAMMTENVSLDQDLMSQERPCSPSNHPVDIAVCVERQAHLLCVGDHVLRINNPVSDRIRDSDVIDWVQEDSLDIMSSVEEGLLLEQARKRRIRLYRQGPSDLRINKRISSKAAGRLRTKSNPSFRKAPKSSTEP